MTGPGDGSLWFLNGDGKLGRKGAGQAPTALPAVFAGSPTDLASAANNTMWVTETVTSTVACVTPAGDPLGEGRGLTGAVAIARGGDGAMWYVSTTQNKLARLVPGACSAEPAVTTYDLPPGTAPTDIAAAATGNDLYVAGANRIVKVTPARTR